VAVSVADPRYGSVTAPARWPERETVTDQSQGVPLAKIQPLVRYWGTDYDWRRAEAKLNALPQFVTEIDGLDIQFAHVRSPQPNALPLLMTHGWPGSIFELLKVVGPLTDPTAHGGRAEDAFHLVLPSLPGYGFSARPQDTGWGPIRMGSAWHELMGRLGYQRYVAQGGDWGAIVSEVMAVQAPAGLLGITRDEMLDDISLYWLTNTGASSSRSYWESATLGGGPFNAVDIPTVPVAVTIFPGEIYRAPRSWAERTFHKLIYWNEVDKGGHFAAWEQPELFVAEIRAAFRSLR
jgi:pimeloyl-ACP methyl ester carboxylesterase